MTSSESDISKWIAQLAEEKNATTAVTELAKMGAVALKPVLHAYTSPINQNMAENAGSVLVLFGEPAVEPLMELLQRDEWTASAAWTLGYIGDARAVAPLILALKNKNQYTRWAAVNALALLRDPRSIEPLIQRLRDRASSVRFLTAKALSDFGDERAISELEKLVSDPSPGIRDVAGDAIANIKARG